jgi:hypothetical protein
MPRGAVDVLNGGNANWGMPAMFGESSQVVGAEIHHEIGFHGAGHAYWSIAAVSTIVGYRYVPPIASELYSRRLRAGAIQPGSAPPFALAISAIEKAIESPTLVPATRGVRACVHARADSYTKKSVALYASGYASSGLILNKECRLPPQKSEVHRYIGTSIFECGTPTTMISPGFLLN